jgi:hypothetical protein
MAMSATGHKWHFSQALLQHAVQARRFGIQQVEGERDRLRRFLLEHLQLAQVRGDVPDLPEQPFLHVLPLGSAGRWQELPGAVGQVVEDGAGLEQAQRCLAAMVDNRRDSPVGADALKACSLLLAFADVHRQQAVFKAQLFEQDADFQAVAGWPVIQVNHKNLALSTRESTAPSARRCS